ncbi:hypothetical protein [Winogradskyella sp.]|uniref:PulJ/GspJ family protein n=1 Tax=Winogradskyella sp. TaxID=1883156 RepID=UPI001B2A7B3E|nr:hypothetical protein [Winogradskyella sp.]MBO6881084.1 hypothetical protein [Winogradskyella sp.]
MKTKVKSFTLNEMVIVMIITAIVAGLAFTVLSLVQRHMWSIQQNFNLNTEFNRLEEALWIDTNNYNAMHYSANENTIKFRTSLDSITYHFQLDYVLRDRDTFHMKIEHKELFFNGEQTSKGKVDAIRLELSKKYKDQQLFIYKISDAKQLMD